MLQWDNEENQMGAEMKEKEEDEENKARKRKEILIDEDEGFGEAVF